MGNIITILILSFKLIRIRSNIIGSIFSIKISCSSKCVLIFNPIIVFFVSIFYSFFV
nr:MAG TPA: hypothetical protein [Caudoviricetes sp.]